MAQDKVTVPVETPYDDSGLKKAQKDLKEVAKDAKEAGQASEQAGDQGASGFGKMAKYAAMATTAIVAVKKTVDFLLSSVRAAAEHARSVNTLSAAFKDVGYTAQGAMKQAQDFASKMQNLTGIADEAFLNAQRLLANYGVVGAKAQEAVQAAYSLSIGRGIEFSAAMDLVAKAAAGQTQALARVGITLGDNIPPAEKFDKVLSQINDKFGATAKAAMGDYITQVNALKESWGDFKEQIGKYLIPALMEVISIGQKAVNVLNNVFGHTQSIMQKAYQKEQEAVAMLTKEIHRQEQMRDKAHISHQRTYNERIANLQKELDKHKAVLNDLQQQANARARNTKLEMEAAEVQAAAIEKTRVAQIKKNEEKKKTIELTKDEKKAQEDLRRAEQERKLNAIGLSTGKDLRGWNKGEGTSAPAPSSAEIFAGQNSQLGSAVDEVEQYNAEAERLENLYQLKKEYINKEITDAELKKEALDNLDKQYTEQQTALLTKQAKSRQQIMGSMWSALSSLATSENKKVAAVGKIAGVAQATISTFTGAAKALELPFPYNLAAMATVLAQGFALVNQIQGIKLAEGGLVKAVTGGIPAVIGEGGSDEAVLPLDDTKAMRRIGGAIAEEGGAVGGGVVVNINVAASGGVEAILEQLTEASRTGVVQALEFANLNYKVGASQQGYSV